MKRILLCFLFLAISLLSLPVVVRAQQDRDRIGRWDKDDDGKLSKDEFPEQFRNRFERLDADGDGQVTQAEFAAQTQRNRRDEATRSEPRPRPNAGPVQPTHTDVAYGKHPKQAFDIWLAESQDGKPTPLVIYIHGGGFRGGDKRSASGQPVADYLNRGISFASMNYRLSDVGPYPIMMHDAARGLQTIRAKAKEWNLDPERVACYGGSAGAGISLWLGFHEDLADPDSDDPIARQSTRIVAAGTQNGQSTYDMRTFRRWFGVPNLKPHPALVTFYAVDREEDWESDRVKQMMTDASAISHLSKDDPPVFMSYNKGDVPVDENSDPGLWVHHAKLGLKLQEAMEKLELECHVTWPGHPSEKYDDIHAFLRDKVSSPGPGKAQQPQENATSRSEPLGRGRVKENGEYYAPPATQERLVSQLKICDTAPAFSLPQSDGGEPIALSDFQGKKPVVLVFGSITCSPFRQKVTEVFDIHKKYRDRLQFLMVYIREAHPESTILFPEGEREPVLKKFQQTDSLQARIDNAESCRALLDVPFPLLVDAEDNGVLAQYGGWPNRLVVVGMDGRIAWDSGQGPRGFQPNKLEQWLRTRLPQ